MKCTAANPIPELPRYLRGPWYCKRGKFVKLFRIYEAEKINPALSLALLIYQYRNAEAKHIANELPDLKGQARRAIMERRTRA